jgi:plastocyanin
MRRTWFMRRFIALAIGVAVFSLILGAAAACGGGDDEESGNGDAATATPRTTAAADNGDDDGGDNGDEGELRLIAKNTLFDKSELRAEAGEVTIIDDNQDPGIVHNVHVFKGSDADGEDMGMTDLEAGPATQTLTLELEADEYFYQCDAHPATMFGTLIVE